MSTSLSSVNPPAPAGGESTSSTGGSDRNEAAKPANGAVNEAATGARRPAESSAADPTGATAGSALAAALGVALPPAVPSTTSPAVLRRSVEVEAPRARPTPRVKAKRQKLRSDDGRLVRGRRSRERIRSAARELFREHGFDGATLRAIAARAEMGASSIYRHVQSKEELLIDELSDMQEEAWSSFRAKDDRNRETSERLRLFFDAQHELLVADRDLTTIALRATTKTEARVSKRVLQLHDRTIGLLMEILQNGRMKGDLAKDIDVLETARVLFHVSNGARIPWANGLVSDDALRASMHQAVDLLFRGVGVRDDAVRDTRA